MNLESRVVNINVSKFYLDLVIILPEIDIKILIKSYLNFI